MYVVRVCVLISRVVCLYAGSQFVIIVCVCVCGMCMCVCHY